MDQYFCQYSEEDCYSTTTFDSDSYEDEIEDFSFLDDDSQSLIVSNDNSPNLHQKPHPPKTVKGFFEKLHPKKLKTVKAKGSI